MSCSRTQRNDAGEANFESERILEYALAYDLLLCNMCLKKHSSSLITYRSGYTATQIDFVLFQKGLCKLVTDVIVISGK